MKKLIAAAATSLIATSALASGPTIVVEPPVVPPAPVVYDWEGGYAGIGAGYVNAMVSHPVASFPNASGGTVSAIAGYNWQSGNRVLGVEAVVNIANLSGGPNDCGLGVPFTCATRVDGFAALRARAGRAHNRTLYFATLGLATDARTFTSFNGISTVTEGARFNGGVVGVGIEQALSDDWTVRGDLEYYFLGSRTTPILGTFTASAIAARLTAIRRF